MNLWDILLSALIIAALALAVTYCAGKNGSGGSACAGDCANCMRPCGEQDEEDA